MKTIQRRYLMARRSAWRRSAAQGGMTILEVLFAIGIVIVGLLGIASLLPLAGHRASESARATEAQALAQAWYSELFTRRIHDSSSWIYYQDISGTINGTPYTPGYTNALTSLTSLNGVKLGTPPTTTLRALAKQAVCIDPLFFTEADMIAATTGATPLGFVQNFPSTFHPADRWYRPAVFPYYQDRYNPTIDPAYPIDGTTSSLAWGDQPRMVRVTFNNGSGLPASAKYVEQMFASQDELAVSVDAEDRSVAPVRMPTLYGTPTAGSTTLPIARAATQTNYSWIATLTPNETIDNLPVAYGTLSVVVIYKRDRLFFNPKDSATVPLARAGDPTPEMKPLGERVAWVLPISGNFYGGTGGRVRLISSDGVPDSLHIGDWVMLSKYISLNSGVAHPVFRWYRVVACDDARYAELDSTADFTAGAGRIPPSNFPSAVGTDPYGFKPPTGDQVWVRDVVLEGPDWDFVMYYPPPSGAFLTPTTATIVNGAVAVIERIVELN